jgi:hypothetical protein
LINNRVLPPMKLQRLLPGLARSQARKAIQRLAGASERDCFEGMGVFMTGLGFNGSDSETGGEHQLCEANSTGVDSSLPTRYS